MTTLHEAQNSLGSTFAKCLTQLTPNEFTTPKERFSALPATARDEKPIRERTGKARLFDVDLDNAVFVRHDYVGSNTFGVTIDYPLIIAYPRSPRWQSAMLDDYLLIRCGVLDSLTRPTGVSLVIVPDGFSVTQSESDPWSYMQITLRVTYDVTKS